MRRVEIVVGVLPFVGAGIGTVAAERIVIPGWIGREAVIHWVVTFLIQAPYFAAVGAIGVLRKPDRHWRWVPIFVGLVAMVQAVIVSSLPGIVDRRGAWGLSLAWYLVIAGGLLLVGGFVLQLATRNPTAESAAALVGPGDEAR